MTDYSNNLNWSKMNKKHPKNGNENDTSAVAGFTLIEVLVAVAIIATGFFAVYNLHLQSIRASNTVRFHLKAPELAKMKISEIDSDLGDITESTGDFGDLSQGYSWKVTLLEMESETVGPIVDQLVKYNLEILNESNSYTLTVYRYFNKSEK